MRGWVWCVQSSERTEKRIRKRPIGAGIDPKKQAKPARFAEDVSEIVDQLNSMPLVGIAGGVIGFQRFNNLKNEKVTLPDSVNIQKSEINTLRNSLSQLQESMAGSNDLIEILQDSLVASNDLIEILQDSLAELGRGIDMPPCLGLQQNGQPNVLMTIQVYPDNQFSIEGITNDIDLSNRWPEIATYFNNTLTQNIKISSNEMINHAQQIHNLSPEKNCVSYVILQNGGVSRDSLILKWKKLDRYNLRLANPRILW